MSQVFITVIITTRDYGCFLPEAIESVLNQSIGREHIELIIVDDGSIDDTVAVAGRYSGSVHYIYQNNRGQAGALNTGFKAANGDFIAFLDADDYFYKTKLEEVTAKFNQDSRIGMVHHRLDVMDKGGGIIHTTPFRMPLDEGWLRERVVRYGGSWHSFVTAGTSALTFRRSGLESIFPIPEDMFSLSADGYLTTQISLYKHVGAIHKSLGVFRRHGRSYWSTQEMTAEIIQNRFIIPMINISESLKRRFPHKAGFVDLRNDFNYMGYCCLLDKLKGNPAEALRDYIFFIKAVYKDSRIRFSYKLWRLMSVAFMLLAPYRIYALGKARYSKSKLFYRLRTKIFPQSCLLCHE